ncbi:hypothetical protein EXIGLDRAFT_346228 [Exidia glandulosa HHB12029]|uniref:Uncharacterized protein n=1 Tax=Exidia glandulosa HHB12029 TaxID=1314781 RepID=A0A165CGR2_EXIGL|nr:hypothetical protein EXIGLDRAFT_346228 [Exidia glandulosa HHB12029]
MCMAYSRVVCTWPMRAAHRFNRRLGATRLMLVRNGTHNSRLLSGRWRGWRCFCCRSSPRSNSRIRPAHVPNESSGASGGVAVAHHACRESSAPCPIEWPCRSRLRMSDARSPVSCSVTRWQCAPRTSAGAAVVARRVGPDIACRSCTRSLRRRAERYSGILAT